jgi:hypothetical protein
MTEQQFELSPLHHVTTTYTAHEDLIVANGSCLRKSALRLTGRLPSLTGQAGQPSLLGRALTERVVVKGVWHLEMSF